MDNYTYTDDDGHHLALTPSSYGIVVNGGGRVVINYADVPTVALELLKAAGRPDLARLTDDALKAEAVAAEKAEAEAAAKVLQGRRHELARYVSGNPSLNSYDVLGNPTRKAVDLVIELEDKLTAAGVK